MVQVKDLTKLKIEDLWREVKWDEEGLVGRYKGEDPKGGEKATGECDVRGITGASMCWSLPA